MESVIKYIYTYYICIQQIMLTIKNLIVLFLISFN